MFKFKLWDTIKQIMIPYSDIWWVEINNPIHFYDTKDNCIGFVPNLIPLYFTGRSDKNGNEIYVGDVLKDYDFPVEFSYGSFGVRICYDLTFVPLYDLEDTDMEVIGNKFENPDLLCNI